jgi:hypothetical protein
MSAARVVAFVFVLLLAVSRPALAVPYTCPESNYDVDLAVVYGNGMFTSLQQAESQRDHLRPLVAERLGHDPYAITFDIAYNDDGDTLSELWEVAKQREVMSVSHFLRVLNSLLPAPDWWAEATKKVATEIDLLAFTADADLDANVQTYRDHHRKGRKIVVLAYSQGNLYANAAHRRLFETALPAQGEQAFGIVGIATPGAEVAGWTPARCAPLGCYTTFAEDVVVNAVRAVRGSTLSPNLDGTALGLHADADLLWHGLLETYLHFPQSRERVLSHVEAFVDELGELEWTIHDAMITVSLEWDSDADLDLHVFENDGTEHVYYAYPAGAAGYLDADDEDGHGPENYRADCGYVEGGSYEFAVGYFSGSGPTTARLRVQVGDFTRTFVRVLAAPQGRASHTDPTPVAFLEVADLGDRNYEFAMFSAE